MTRYKNDNIDSSHGYISPQKYEYVECEFAGVIMHADNEVLESNSNDTIFKSTYNLIRAVVFYLVFPLCVLVI